MKHPLAHVNGIHMVVLFASGVLDECPLCDGLATQVLLVTESMVGYECRCGCSWRQKANKFQRRRDG